MFGYKQTYGYFLKQGSPAFMPDISVVPEITVGMIPLALEVPVVDRDSVTVAPGTISAGIVSLTHTVPSVDKESIKVAPGVIVVDLFVPES
jgi:hypothetical protein